MSSELILMLAIVAIVCFALGYRVAECSRGWHDMKNAWRRRKDHRR